MITVIRSDEDYNIALIEFEQLVDENPTPGTLGGDRLELLRIILKDYESKKFHLPVTSPLDAIQFRMDQQNLSPRDLIPYIGSRSKVSEVLSRKRPLTLTMIRALHNGLGIPAKVLLQGEEKDKLDEPIIEWNRFPIREMSRRGWIGESSNDTVKKAEIILRKFFASLGSAHPIVVQFRKSNHIRSARAMDEYALIAWMARVTMRALKDSLPTKFIKGSVNLELMQEFAKLSRDDDGPLKAREYLRKIGIPLIIESHLPNTYLDGAAMLINVEKPIIGLTLRYDRIDNFWFSIMHELAHIALHLEEGYSQFIDDLDVDDKNDQKEKDADKLASEALIPQEAWANSPASKLKSPDAAEYLAKRLGIHPAIVAGRMRHEFKAYRLLNNLVGHKQVRKYFSEVNWGNVKNA